MADQEYGRVAPVPKMVQDFVVYFYRHISERNIREIYTMYSHTFPHLSERFFKGSPWPPAEAIAHLVDGDTVFLMLYQELTFRHAHQASGAVPAALRAASWRNYSSLFRVVLDARLNARLPNAWLWDMIDEFVSQFQGAATARGRGSAGGSRLASAAAHEAAQADDDGTAWRSADVLAILNELVDRSRIREEIGNPDGAERLFASEGYGQGESNVLRMLGYFSLLGLLRAHVLLGEPEKGLRSLSPIAPLARQRLFATKIALACVSLYYHSAFAYLQLRRYLDSARCLAFALSYVPRVRATLPRGPQQDRLLKTNEQLYALAALNAALCPASSRSYDDGASTLLREKHGDKIRQMAASGASEPFEDLFGYASPKFVPRDGSEPRTDAAAIVAAAAGPGAPGQVYDARNAGAAFSARPARPGSSAAAGVSAAAAPASAPAPPSNPNAEAYRAQLHSFLSVVEERKHLPAIVSLLGLYASVPLAKLALISEMDEAQLRTQLELLEASTHVLTWSGGDALAGEPVSAGELDFSFERVGGEDVVVVRETRAAAGPSCAFLVAHVQKLREITSDLDAISLAPPAEKPLPAGAVAAAAK